MESQLAEAQRVLQQERREAAAKETAANIQAEAANEAARTAIAAINKEYNDNVNDFRAQLNAMRDEIHDLRTQSSKPEPPTYNTYANNLRSEFPEFSQSPSPISTHAAMAIIRTM